MGTVNAALRLLMVAPSATVGHFVNRRHFLAASAVTLVVLSTIPISASAQSLGTRSIALVLRDNRYEPKSPITVRKGEKVKFVFINKGKVLHEALIAPAAAQLRHETEMAGMGAMAMPDEADRVSVKPGATKTLMYTFGKSGAIEIGCHQPLHYRKGMKVIVNVR